jgi:phosphatidate phosphatase PAH1
MTMMWSPRIWIAAAGMALLLACGDDAATGDPTSGAETTAGTTAAADSTTGTTAAVDSTTSETGEPTSSSSTAADSSESGTTGGVCELEQPAIVTDIDETLTLSDAEFFMQIADGTYDPVEREGAAELIVAYADLGYRILYLTARSEDIVLVGTGETARDATDRWLLEHGFPTDPATTLVVLSPMLVVGDAAQAYKAGALMDQQAAGWRFDYAYGNATTDIGAYADAGIDPAVTFIIGEHAGEGGTVAVAGEGWVEHAAAHLPTVPAVCEAAQ